jgi:hypothetical protein
MMGLWCGRVDVDDEKMKQAARLATALLPSGVADAARTGIFIIIMCSTGLHKTKQNNNTPS